VEGFVDGIGDEDDCAVFGLEHSFGDAMVEEGEQRRVEAVGVEEEDRLGVDFEGLPGEDFEELLEGAEAARQGDEGVGAAADEGLAGVHGVGDVQLGEAVVGDFEVDEKGWDDADDAAAGVECALGDGVHEADFGSAVDDADVALGEGAAEFERGGAVDGVGAVGGGAEDGNIFDRHVQ